MTIDRDEAIRTLLINTATRPTRRHWIKTTLIAAIAFLLGGGLAAGALSAAAVSGGNTSSIDIVKDTFSYFLHGGRTLGPLVSRSGTGSTSLDLGPRPAQATGIATLIECGGTGSYMQILGGEVRLEQQCGPNGVSGFSSDHNPTDTIVATKTDGKFAYKIWAQWIYVPAPSGPSAAQQAALADGVISEAEYHAAVDRFAACMSGAGYPVTDIKYSPTLSWGNSSDANRTGVIDRCGDEELNQVVKAWQAVH